MKQATIVFLVANLASAAATGAEKTIPTEGKSRLEVVIVSGDIQIIGGDGKDVQFESDGDHLPAVSLDGESIRIGTQVTTPEAEKDSTPGTGFVGGDSIVFHVPAAFSIEVHTTSGDLTVENIAGRCRLGTVSGDIKVKRSPGPTEISTVSGDVAIGGIKTVLSIATVSGDVTAESPTGDLLEVKTVSGDIRLLQAGVSQIRLKSHSGDIRFEGSVPGSGSLRAKAFSGDVTALLPAGAGFDLEAGTKSGVIEIGVDLKYTEKSSDSVKGRNGTGGATIELGTFSGDIAVKPGR